MALFDITTPVAGINNVQKEYAPPFQLSDQGALSLITAQNIDIDNFGIMSMRSGTSEVISGTAHKTLVSVGGMLLVQDEGNIYQVTPGSPFTRSLLVSGLSSSATVKFFEAFGQVFYTNGIVCGRLLVDGTSLPWGLGVAPSPTLGTAVGTLEAGRYRVAATLVNANDQDRAGTVIASEGGALKASSVVVDGSQDITATLTPGDANATHVNFYIAPANQKELFFAKQVAVGSLPTTISNARYSTRPLRTQHMRGPIPANGLSSYLGFLLLWRDNWVFRSKGQTPNLFFPKQEVLGFPYNVKQVLSVKNGIYVGTEKGMYWVSGNDPKNWSRDRLDSEKYVPGGMIVQGSDIPALQTNELVAVFCTEKKLVFGLPGGGIRHELDDRLTFASTPTSASMTYRESSEIRQILLSLT